MLFDPHFLPLPQCLHRSKRGSCYTEKVIVWDRRRAPGKQCGDKLLPGGAMAFILPQPGMENLASAILDHFQGAEVVQDRDAPSGQNLDPFLRKSLVAIRQVADRPQGAVRESKRQY